MLSVALTNKRIARLGYISMLDYYLKVGYYMEIFFVGRGVRYIEVNDGVDSAKGENDFTPFRNLFNVTLL